MVRKISLVVALLALVAIPSSSFAGGGSGAGSGAKATKLTIKTGNSAGQFKGRVNSDAAKCTRNRKVRVFQKMAGPDLEIGADRSNYKGRWKASTAAMSGEWYAKVGRVVKGSTICKGDRSKTVSAG